MTGFLSKKQRKELVKALRLEKNAKYSDRIKCILLLDEGEPEAEISHYLFITLGTVKNYYLRYQSGGIKQLVNDNHQGSKCFLTDSQLSDHLEDKLYLTTSAIQKHVFSKYGIDYSENGIRHLLKRLGFVFKKPKAIPGKANRELQAQFLADLEPKLADNTGETAVFFADGTHPQHNTHCAYGWIKKGKNKEIKTNTGRKRVNINGLINATDPTQVIIDECDSINAQSTVRLFKELENQYPDLEEIFVVADNARYYKCLLVQEYLKNSRITLLYLPPYSPNLNIIERLWRLLKKEVLYNRYIEKFADFKKAILGFFEDIKDYKVQLTSLMNLKFHLIGS